MGHGPGRGGWVRVVMIATVILSAGSLGVFVLWKVLGITEHNRTAIEVSCLVLSDKIVEAGGTATPSSTKAGMAQAKLTALLVGVIARDMTAAEILKATEYRKTIDEEGGALSLPDCKAIAADPKGYLDAHR